MTALKGKTVIVTGAATGVGRAVAERLVSGGANVMLAGSNEDALKSIAASLTSNMTDDEDKNRVARFSCDISQKFGVNNLLAATVSTYDRIDALITTTTDFEKGDLLTMKVDVLDRLMASNLRSAFLITQAAAHKMIAQAQADGADKADAAVVHVSSLSGQLASPEVAAYAASCAALQQLTRSFAAALAGRGVRVNGVAPGGVMTETLKESIATTPELRTTLIGRTPLGRIGEVAEAAEAALFLASERASFITGQTLIVDGGRSILDPLAAASL